MTAEQKQRRKVNRAVVFHLLAAVAVVISIVTFEFSSLCENDSRVFALGRVFIFHRGGQIVVVTPPHRPVEVNLFTHVDPDLICAVCTAYLAVWLSYMGMVLVAERLRRRRQEPGPRGFPLD